MKDRQIKSDLRLLIVGNPETTHVGHHLHYAAQQEGVTVELCDTRDAFASSWPVIQLNWRLRGHRPPRLRSFGRRVVKACHQFEPQWLLATGLAPLNASALQQMKQMGVVCLNYLTDDPWNPQHHANWFLRAIIHYDAVFSPRRSNLEDLAHLGCRDVAYLPFAYAPEIHFPELLTGREERQSFDCDVLFFGGADSDRLPYITSLLRSGLKVHLYGGYWDRYSETRAHTRGLADPMTLRKAVSGARVTLCLVRRTNRDGQVMRTFEAPAMGACMLVEDTPEHREIFGEDRESVVYFGDADEMVEGVHWLLSSESERRRLVAAAQAIVVANPNTYRDRLLVMLEHSPATGTADVRHD